MGAASINTSSSANAFGDNASGPPATPSGGDYRTVPFGNVYVGGTAKAIAGIGLETWYSCSSDGGATWTNVSKNVPGIGETYHISRVEPSRYDAATCYLAVDGHRLDDMKPYLFVTKDYGATWTSIVNNLPKWGNVNVVREDPRNKDLRLAQGRRSFRKGSQLKD